MCFMNGKKITDIGRSVGWMRCGGISEVVYNGTRLWSKYLFKRVVVVGDSTIGFAFSKDDGSTFTRVAIGGSHRNLKAVKRIGNAVYVAGDGGLIAKTTDLDSFATWTVLTGDSSLNYIDICEGGGNIVILAEGNKCSIGTTSATTFTTVSMPGTNLGPMAYGNGTFVSPSGTYNGNGAYSTNGGQTWTAVKVCATKRHQPSGWPPEVYPCRNICFGNGYFFAASGVWDGSNNHYEYSYSADGKTWHVVPTDTGSWDANFCYREVSFFFNGYFYALDFRDFDAVDSTRIAEGTKKYGITWDFTQEKYSAFALGNLALVASCGGYMENGNWLGVYRDEISDGACQFVKEIPLEGTIREVLAI